MALRRSSFSLGLRNDLSLRNRSAAGFEDAKILALGPGPVCGCAGCCGPLLLVLLLLLLGPSIGVRQIGQVLCSLSHMITHSPWNQCLQGRTSTSSPLCIESMHIVHSALPSGPSISSSIFLCSRLSIAALDAGGAAFDWGLDSMRVVMMRSRASWEYTASPWGPAAAGLSRAARMSCKLAANTPPRCCGPPPGLPARFGSLGSAGFGGWTLFIRLPNTLPRC